MFRCIRSIEQSIGGTGRVVRCGAALVRLRLHWEERALVAVYGERYREYQRRVNRLLPQITR